jgi:oxygen-independent coproporphyrinogen-3 oxidase
VQKNTENFQILNFISNFAVTMAGLYLHIPFCKSRCIYCNFYSTTHADMRQRYVDALCKEMEMKKPTPSQRDGRLSTIYLGGGTPSQLTIPQLRQLFYNINKVYSPTSHLSPLTSEITIEMNPDDVTVEYAEALSQLGINRVSMGAQTFDDERLRFLHRRHTAGQVAEAVKRLRAAGIQNISIDLMYGFPNETIEDWQRDIDAALALNVEHISAYCLMIEEGTPLYQWTIDNSQLTIDEELERQMYETLIDKLTAAGYEHYEISNFARPGYRSLHNSSYWKDIPYIGLGAAAHGYNGKKRSWNVADIKQYIESIEQGVIPCEEEFIDEDTHYNDRITTALRTSDGLDLTTLSDHHRRYCLQEALRFIDDGLLKLDNNHLSLTRKGLFVSDYVMSSLIMV